MKTLMMLLTIAGVAHAQSPYDAYVEKSRQGLSAAGLVRKSSGGLVYWTSKPSKKPPLVLLHGVNEQAGTWSEVVSDLSRDYRLIVPDLAGHGESEPKTGPITYKAMLDGIAAVIDREAKTGNLTLVGNSMGGWLAMLYAFDHPDRVQKLVLEDASGMVWLPADVPLFAKTREEAAKVLRAVHGPDYKISDELLDAFLARKNTPLSRISMNDALAYLVDKRLPELKMPVALIWGRHDGLLPVPYAEALQKKISGSTLTILEDAAHIPHRQQPRKFVQCLKTTC